MILLKNQTSQFNNLPADIHRLLAFYLDGCNIVRLYRLNKHINDIYKNLLFLRDLAYERLTKEDDRLLGKNIIKEIHDCRTLKEAIANGYLEKVKKLRVDIYIRDYSLSSAVEHNYLDIVKYLIEAPNGQYAVDIHLRDDAALKTAIFRNHLAIVKYLISKGADIHSGGDHPLILAVKKNHLDILKHLVSLGADIHSQNEIALKIAAENGYLNMVKYLVSQGANIHIWDGRGVAFCRGRPLQVYTYLKSVGANVYII